jgi:hypothetical protein
MGGEDRTGHAGLAAAVPVALAARFVGDTALTGLRIRAQWRGSVSDGAGAALGATAPGPDRDGVGPLAAARPPHANGGTG